MKTRYKKRIQQAKELGKIFVGIRIAVDAAVIAASEVFGMGPVRCVKFVAVLKSTIEEIADIINADSRYDPEIIYAREKIDKRLKKICGDNFEPWEVRYK